MTVPIIKDSSGLNTVADPFQPQSKKDLAEAVNVRITDSNRIERVGGLTSLFDLTAGHSLFCDGGACLVHDAGSMYEVAADLTLSAAKRTGMSGDLIDHTQYGDAIYYGNRSENGVYYGGSHLAWALDTYTGPTTARYFETSVPLFDHIATFNGYMLGSIDNALFASELGKPGLWEMKPVWMSNSKIIMIRPVEAGVFVSDLSRQFFLRGVEPVQFVEEKKATYLAREWSAAHSLADASEFLPEASGLAAGWISRKGQCIGTADGQFINITEKRIALPNEGTLGASLFYKTNFISTLR